MIAKTPRPTRTAPGSAAHGKTAHGKTADGGSAGGSAARDSTAACMARACTAAVRRTFVRSTAWTWLPLLLAGLATPILLSVDALAGAVAPVWFVAVIWTVFATFVHALWQGFRHGDWSAFAACDVSRDDEDHDWALRTGRFAFMRVRARDEAHTRESGRFLQDHDHLGSAGRSPAP